MREPVIATEEVRRWPARAWTLAEFERDFGDFRRDDAATAGVATASETLVARNGTAFAARLGRHPRTQERLLEFVARPAALPASVLVLQVGSRA